MGLQSLVLFGLFSAGLATKQDLPQFGINIAPTFHQENASVAHLDLQLRVRDPSARANRTLLYMGVNRELPPYQRYDGDALTATDDQGELPFTYNDINDGADRHWFPKRDPVGDVVVSFTAEPRGDIDNLSGRADLRYDRAGVMGQGSTFIPYPPRHEIWNMTVTWDIHESAPDGTRSTSAFGDAQESTEVGYPSRVVGDSMFAVGPLQRWPSWDQVDQTKRSDDRVFAMYWIGDLPYDVETLANDVETIYGGTAEFFGDLESDYRVFFRLDFKAYGGQGGYKSFVLEYYDGAEKDNALMSFENLLSHEIIHSFALTYPEEDWEKWYVEGSAEYLKSVASFTGGGLNKTTFADWLNGDAQDYYTASSLGKTWEYVITDYWTKGNAAIKTPYTRGAMFLAYLQGQIVAATNGTHSVDDVILELYHKYTNGDKVRTPQIIESVARYLGKEAAQASYDSFANGTLLVPEAEGFAKHGLKLVRKDLKKLDIGMDQNSIGLEKVTKLVPGSRAQKAGLREGDKIVNVPSVWDASGSYESTIKFTVDRNGTKQDIEYWPRSDELVEAYQWVEIDQ